MYFASKSFDFLVGSPLVNARDVSPELLKSLFDRRWVIVIGFACVALTVMVAAFITPATWLFFWLAADGILTVARWKVMSHAMSATIGSRQAQVLWHLLAVLPLCWCAVFGAAMFCLVWTGEPALMVNASVLTISVSSAITSRNAAMPRMAMIAILLVTLPFFAATFLLLDQQRWIVFIVYVPLLFSSYSLTMQNHRILVRLICAEREARVLAYTDALTGLPNRLSFALHQEDIAMRSEGETTHAYMCLDLDGFKEVNDRHGHPAGDLLLKAVAARLSKITRSGDIVFRIGGDEFIVYMPGAKPEDCGLVARRIIKSMSEPFALSGDLTVSIGCSAGSACLTEASRSAASIVKVADEALYKAKRNGKSRHIHAA